METNNGVLKRALVTYKRWPKWVRIAAPVLTAFLIIGALGGDAEDEQNVAVNGIADVDAVTSTTTEPATLTATDAIGETEHDFASTAELAQIIDVSCANLEAAESASTAAAATNAVIARTLGELSVDDYAELVDTVGEVAPEVCPDGVEAHPEYLGELVTLAPEPTTTTTAAPTTTVPPPTTTMAPPPPPPTTTTTVAPPPPPTTVYAPSTYYDNCTEARSAGVTPLYRGDPGYGSHLDRDDDGVACE